MKEQKPFILSLSSVIFPFPGEENYGIKSFVQGQVLSGSHGDSLAGKSLDELEIRAWLLPLYHQRIMNHEHLVNEDFTKPV